MGARNVHDRRLRWYRDTMASRFAGRTLGWAQSLFSTTADGHCDGADGDRNCLLAMGETIGRTYQPGSYADVSSTWKNQTVGRFVLCRVSIHRRNRRSSDRLAVAR